MHPADIQAALKKRGLSQKVLAERIGVVPNTVSKVIRRLCVSDQVMRGISQAIGRHPAEVFPEHFLSPMRRRTGKQLLGDK